jgi:hypothetical protein
MLRRSPSLPGCCVLPCAQEGSPFAAHVLALRDMVLSSHSTACVVRVRLVQGGIISGQLLLTACAGFC